MIEYYDHIPQTDSSPHSERALYWSSEERSGEKDQRIVSDLHHHIPEERGIVEESGEWRGSQTVWPHTTPAPEDRGQRTQLHHHIPVSQSCG